MYFGIENKMAFRFFLGQNVKNFLRRCETLSSAREIATMALSAEQARHTENVFHIALSSIIDKMTKTSTKS